MVVGLFVRVHRNIEDVLKVPVIQEIEQSLRVSRKEALFWNLTWDGRGSVNHADRFIAISLSDVYIAKYGIYSIVRVIGIEEVAEVRNIVAEGEQDNSETVCVSVGVSIVAVIVTDETSRDTTSIPRLALRGAVAGEVTHLVAFEAALGLFLAEELPPITFDAALGNTRGSRVWVGSVTSADVPVVRRRHGGASADDGRGPVEADPVACCSSNHRCRPKVRLE